MSIQSISPAPSDEEAAAIAAAIEICWPRPQARTAPKAARSGWRFSGRWWSSGDPTRRRRPER